jgi:hypothetical protein
LDIAEKYADGEDEGADEERFLRIGERAFEMCRMQDSAGGHAEGEEDEKSQVEEEDDVAYCAKAWRVYG